MRPFCGKLAPAVVCFVILSAVTVYATQLPWEDKAKKCRTRTFLDHPIEADPYIHTGEDFLVADEGLYPMDNGNIKEFCDNLDTDPFTGENPNFIIIYYQGQQYASMYYHIKKGSVVANLPELAGQQGLPIDTYASTNKQVARTDPDLPHIHVEMGNDENSFFTNRHELISPSSKFQDIFIDCSAQNPRPQLAAPGCGHDTVPIGWTDTVYVPVYDEDGGCSYRHGIRRMETFCNGQWQDGLQFVTYDANMSKRWILGEHIWPDPNHCGVPGIWYLKTTYRMEVAGSNNVVIEVYDDCEKRAEFDFHPVDVNDIASFNAYQSLDGITLYWEIIEGYTVTSVDLYRSDHILGPYEKLTSSPIPITHSGLYTYTDHAQYTMNYYYKIWAAGPGEGYKTAHPFPILNYGDDPPPEPQPVTNLTAADRPLDSGNVITVNWVPSPTDTSVQKYNIYRGSSGVYRYYDSVPRGVSMFEDTSAGQDFQWCYKLIAHNGVNGSSESNESCASALDNFEYLSVTMPDSEYACRYLRFCPKGDWDTLKVNTRLLGSDKQGTPNIDRDDLQLELSAGEGNILCEGNAVGALFDTDAGGNTLFEYSHIGGCGPISCIANCRGLCSSNRLDIYAKSPDLDASGAVTLSDAVIYSRSHNKMPPDSCYNPCCDFNCDNKCNLSDFAFMGAHYAHRHEPQMSTEPVSSVESNLSIVFEDVAGDEGQYRTAIALENAQEATALMFAIDYDPNALEFVSWAKDPSFPKETIVSPVINSGKRMVVLMCHGDGAALPGSCSVGTLTFRVGKSQLMGMGLTESAGCLTFDTGEVMDKNGTTRMIGSARYKAGKTVLHDYLGRNYPNPFNPSTTIEYSISAEKYIELSIYDAAGKRIRLLEHGVMKPGVHKVTWDGINDHGQLVGSGIYFCRLKAGTFVKSSKIILIR
jgi:hypothetical protein